MPAKNLNQRYNAYNAQPFVGYVASSNTVEVVQASGNLICRPTRASSLVLLLAGAMIFVTAVFASQSPEAGKLQKFWHYSSGEKIGIVVLGAFILLLVGVALVFIVKKLLWFGTLIVDGNGFIRLCQGWWRRELRVIHRGEIKNLCVESVDFRGDRAVYVNYLLILELVSLESIVLCASVDQAMILQLQRDMTARIGCATE